MIILKLFVARKSTPYLKIKDNRTHWEKYFLWIFIYTVGLYIHSMSCIIKLIRTTNNFQYPASFAISAKQILISCTHPGMLMRLLSGPSNWRLTCPQERPRWRLWRALRSQMMLRRAPLLWKLLVSQLFLSLKAFQSDLLIFLKQSDSFQ